MTAERLFALLALAALGLLLSSCGSGNRIVGTVLTQTTLPQRTLSTPTETAVGETTTALLEPETTTVLVTTTTQQIFTVSLTETVAVTEPAPPPVTTTTSVTTTTVNPAAAAAAGAAIAAQNTEATSTASNAQWGWVAFGILAAGVLGGAIWWLVKRRSPKSSA